MNFLNVLDMIFKIVFGLAALGIPVGVYLAKKDHDEKKEQQQKVEEINLRLSQLEAKMSGVDTTELVDENVCEKHRVELAAKLEKLTDSTDTKLSNIEQELARHSEKFGGISKELLSQTSKIDRLDQKFEVVGEIKGMLSVLLDKKKQASL